MIIRILIAILVLASPAFADRYLNSTTDSITAELGATDNAVLDAIELDTSGILTSVQTLDNAIAGSEMQVDVVGALPAGTNLIGKITITDGSEDATVRDTGTSDSLNVAIVDASGNQITTFGGGTQYTEGDIDATITGTAMLGEGPSNTLTPLALDASGNLNVTGNWIQGYATNAVVPADPEGVSVQMERDDALSTLTEVEGDWTNQRATAEGALWTQDFNSDAALTALQTLDNVVAGSEAQVDVVGALPAGTNNIGKFVVTDGTEDATVRDTGASDSLNVSIVDASGNQITSFGGSGGTAMNDDAAFTVGTTQITPAGGTYKSTRDVVDDNDAGAFAMTSRRGLYVSPESPSGDSLVDDTDDHLIVGGKTATTTGSITTSSTSIVHALNGHPSATVQITGTYGSVAFGFSGSNDGGTTYNTIQAVRSDANTIETASGTISNTTRLWRLDTNGLTHLRVLATAWASGTGAITIRSSSLPTHAIPAAQVPGTLTVSGTVTANLGTGGTSATSATKAEDGAAANGDTNVAIMAVRRDTLASTTSANNDYSQLAMSDDGGLYVHSAPTAAQTGNTSAFAISAASTNATSTKASAGKLYGYAVFNNNSTSARYLKFYNKASAPTVGTDTPVLVVLIPPLGGANLDIANGLNFSTGIAWALTTGAANSDTGAVALSEIVVNFWYK